MDGYLNVIIARLLMQGADSPVAALTEGETHRRVRTLKADIRARGDLASVHHLTQYMATSEDVSASQGVVLEDDFLAWLVYELHRGGASHDRDERVNLAVLSFFCVLINNNLRAMMRLTVTPRFLEAITRLASERRLTIVSRRSLVAVLACLIFDYDECHFRHEAVRAFLEREAIEGDAGPVSIGLVAALFPEAPMVPSEAVIAATVSGLDLCCRSPTFSHGLWPASAFLKVVRALCSWPLWKVRLARHFKLFFLLKRIMTDARLKIGDGMVREVLSRLYSGEQIADLLDVVSSVRSPPGGPR